MPFGSPDRPATLADHLLFGILALVPSRSQASNPTVLAGVFSNQTTAADRATAAPHGAGYDLVLYLDADILVLDDLTGLFRAAAEGVDAAAALTRSMMGLNGGVMLLRPWLWLQWETGDHRW